MCIFLSVLHSWKMPDTKHIYLFQNWIELFFCDQIWPCWSHALCQRDINSLCLIWLSAEDSKALCFYLIWGTVWFYSRVYRPVWSIRLIRILHCHLLCRQCFKTSIFLFCQQPLLPQSHNNLYPTDVISQSKLSTTLSRRMLLVSRTKKKPCTDLLLSLPVPQSKVRDTGENTVTHKTCSHVLSVLFLSGWFIYTCIRQTSLVIMWHLAVFFSILRHECRI